MSPGVSSPSDSLASSEPSSSSPSASSPDGAQREAKRSFYRRPDVAAAYDQQRFGGPSGARVNQRELRIVAGLLPESLAVGDGATAAFSLPLGEGQGEGVPGAAQSEHRAETAAPATVSQHTWQARGLGTVADVACGTGRLLPLLRSRARCVVGLDASAAMLEISRHRSGAELVQADAFRLPLRDGACDAVTSVRILFHFDDPAPLLRELRRITRPGGTLVCDTANWSPRGLLPLSRGRWGERVATIRPSDFRDVAASAGWRVREERPCFLVSPYVYRKVPLDAARVLERLERALPRRLLCRTFWALEALT